MTGASHLYRRLARALLPASLLIEAEHELVETFDAAHARIARRAWPRRALFWIAIVVDLIATGISERVARMGGWMVDLRYVLRGLAASRSYTAIAILSLGLGIGANSAVFSVIRAVLLDEMAVSRPEDLSFVYWHHPGSMRIGSMNSSSEADPKTGLRYGSNYSYPIYDALRRAAPDGVAMAGFNFARDLTVQVGDMPGSPVGGMFADGAFFDVVRPRIALGRALGIADDRDDAAPAAVLSHRLWMRLFGGDRAIVGQTIRVNRISTRIAGVTAPEFIGVSKGGFFPQADITLPLRLAERYQPEWRPSTGPLLHAERTFWVRLIARVQADVEETALSTRLASPMTASLTPLLTDKTNEPASVALFDASRGLDQAGDDTRTLLWVLMGVVLTVLVIACVNLASLMLARGIARQRELSVRRALGAGRARIVRVLVLEALVLAFAGGATGLLLTWWSRAALTTVVTAGLGSAPRALQPLDVPIDMRLVAATFGISLAAALVFSLLPAWRLTTDRATGDLSQRVVGARSPRLTLGRLLVAAQIAVTVPLVVGAILFLQTLSRLGSVQLGFDPQNLVLFKIDPSKVAAGGEPAPIYVALLERIRAIPGVSSVTLIENALLSGIQSGTQLDVDGRRERLRMNAVGPDFAGTMGIRLLAGRAPGVQDGPGAPAVAAINEAAARKFFGERSPIGQVLKVNNRTVEVVGVLSDSLYETQRRAPGPTMFDSALQRPGYGGTNIAIRTALSPERLEPEIKRALLDVHRDLPMPALRSQIEQIQISTTRERVFAQTLSLFGGFTLLLACVGLHGVTSYAVRRRRNEIGLRMALGAQRRDMVWMVQRQVLLHAALGVAAGIPLALAAAPLVGSLLFGVAPRDTIVIATAALIMLATAAAAGVLPARRAASMDPLQALRSD